MSPVSVIRRVRTGTAVQTLGMNHHRNRQLTNGEKVWRRYAGCLVVAGSGVYRDWQGRSFRVEPGCFVHHLPDRYHDIRRHDAGWEEYSLMSDAASCGRWQAQGLIDEERPVLPVGSLRAHVRQFERLHRLLQGDEEADWRRATIVAADLLLGLWEAGQRWRLREQGDLALEEARARLAADHRAEIALEDLAAACGLSYIAFRRAFKRHFGQSPGAYRNAQRLDHAALVLAHERCTVAELAERLGYADPFVFSRRFKQQYDLPPSNYHRRHFTE